MARAECSSLCLLVFAFVIFVRFARCDTEYLRNTPPELSPSGKSAGDQIQARFIPFSASVALGLGNNAQSFSVAGGPNGVGLSQSSSHGSPDYSASQSSSLAAGLNGISASDSTAHSVNHPLYGPTAQATGNSFSLGQASSAAHGDVINGQAVTSAQSVVSSTQTQASSGSQNYYRPAVGRPAWNNAPPSYASGNPGNYYYNSKRGPSLTISVSDNPTQYGKSPNNGWYAVPDSNDDWVQPDLCRFRDSWYRDPRCRTPKVEVTRPGYRPGYNRPGYQRPYYENIRDPRESEVAQASAGSSAQSGPGGLSIGQSSSQSGNGNRGPHSLTINRVETTGNAQAHAQGASGSVQQQNRPGSLQANLSSGSISASSGPGGSSQGSSVSSSSGGNSNSQVTGSSQGAGSAHGSANAGSVTFPGASHHSAAPSIIPPEYVRSAKKLKNKKKDEKGPIEELITDITDTVYDIFDY